MQRRSRQDGCELPDCSRPHRASGLGSPHYRQRQRGEELRPLSTVEPGAVCELAGCGRPRLSRGWCAGHYSQQREGRTSAALRLSTPVAGEVVDCQDRHHAPRITQEHFSQGRASD